MPVATAHSLRIVGICQYVQHPPWIRPEGFKAALTDMLGEGNVEYRAECQWRLPTCATIIINGFVSSSVDLILANATAPCRLQRRNGHDSVIGTSVTDYATALAIDDRTGTTGRNITGTSDLAPLDSSRDDSGTVPRRRTVGLLYCSARPNSVYQVDTIEGYLTEMGYTVSVSLSPTLTMWLQLRKVPATLLM